MKYGASFDLQIRHYQLEGFLVGRAQCSACDFKWVAITHPQGSRINLECPACHRHGNYFTEFPPIVMQTGRDGVSPSQ